MGTVTANEPISLTDSDLVRMIINNDTECEILKLKIRDLKLQADQLEAANKILAAERNDRILRAMELKGAVAEHVATQYGVSRGWIWKLLKRQCP
jgi:hypothetical protein